MFGLPIWECRKDPWDHFAILMSIKCVRFGHDLRSAPLYHDRDWSLKHIYKSSETV